MCWAKARWQLNEESEELSDKTQWMSLNVKHTLETSLLIVWWSGKYVSGSFWVEKTHPSTFRALWEKSQIFVRSKGSFMALNKTQVEISTHFDAAERIFRCLEKVNRTLWKIFEMHPSRLAELWKTLYIPSKVSQFILRNCEIYATLYNQKAGGMDQMLMTYWQW